MFYLTHAFGHSNGVLGSDLFKIGRHTRSLTDGAKYHNCRNISILKCRCAVLFGFSKCILHSCFVMSLIYVTCAVLLLCLVFDACIVHLPSAHPLDLLLPVQPYSLSFPLCHDLWAVAREQPSSIKPSAVLYHTWSASLLWSLCLSVLRWGPRSVNHRWDIQIL
jgi:hypothetical protein